MSTRAGLLVHYTARQIGATPIRTLPPAHRLLKTATWPSTHSRSPLPSAAYPYPRALHVSVCVTDSNVTPPGSTAKHHAETQAPVTTTLRPGLAGNPDNQAGVGIAGHGAEGAHPGDSLTRGAIVPAPDHAYMPTYTPEELDVVKVVVRPPEGLGDKTVVGFVTLVRYVHMC